MKQLSMEDVMKIAGNVDFEAASKLVGYDAKAAYDRMNAYLDKIGWAIPTQDMAYITNFAYKVSQETPDKQTEILTHFAGILKDMVDHFNEAKSLSEAKG
jgi:hypothetical protein